MPVSAHPAIKIAFNFAVIRVAGLDYLRIGMSM
jgi:hypothetical protein